MFCVSCRHLSPPGPVCERCGAPLEERRDPPPQHGPLESLRAWTLELRSGDLDRPEFLRRLQERRERLLAVLQGLDALDLPDDMVLEVQEELNTGRQGIQGFLEALDALAEWAGTGRKDALDRGIALATQADARMNQAVLMNWRSFRTYQEAADEFLEQVGYQGPPA